MVYHKHICSACTCFVNEGKTSAHSAVELEFRKRVIMGIALQARLLDELHRAYSRMFADFLGFLMAPGLSLNISIILTLWSIYIPTNVKWSLSAST